MNLKQKTIHSFKWLFLARVSQKALSFATFIVLARILEPKDFGLFAMAFVVIDGLGMFQSLGIDSALIQRKDNVERAANTAFFIFPIVGIILFLVLTIFAPFAASMLREPSLTSVIRILGLIYIIKCFSRVPSALYVKELNFKTKAIIELSAEVFNSTVAITLAFLKFGVWSLVYAYLVKQLITFIGFWKFCPWRLRPEFDWHIARELIHFGKFVFGSSLLWFLVKNLDRMVIGRLLGTVILGFYAIAYNIANLTATHFTGLVSQVMFPAYSKIQNDRNKMEEVFLRTMKYISLVSIPFCVGIFILAPDFLRIVYGEKWLPASGALRVLVWMGLINTFNAPSGPVFLALGKAKIDFLINIVHILTLSIFLYPLTKTYYLIGACIAILFSFAIRWILRVIWIEKLLGISLKKLFLTVHPSIKGTSVMLLSMLIVRLIPLKLMGMKLCIVILVCSAIYLVYLFKTKILNLANVKYMILK